MTATITLVRHGEAAAGWGDDHDPGLSELGRTQAEAVALAIETAFPRPVPILSSPKLRCRETAAPLARRWAVDVTVEPAVGEIESPDPDLAARSLWLDEFLHGRWSKVHEASRRWRQRVLDRLTAIDDDAVVFTHFVAINVAIGAATGDDRVMCRRVANCSITTFVVEDGSLVLVDAPAEQATEVL